MCPPGARVWIAMGHTDMRKSRQVLALLVQQALGRDPFGGDLFVFRGRAGSLTKIIWHDGIGMSLYAKRLFGHQLAGRIWRPRSEEHTSELQSLMRISYAVFCLKKKKMNNVTLHNNTNPQHKHQSSKSSYHMRI